MCLCDWIYQQRWRPWLTWFSIANLALSKANKIKWNMNTNRRQICQLCLVYAFSKTELQIPRYVRVNTLKASTNEVITWFSKNTFMPERRKPMTVDSKVQHIKVISMETCFLKVTFDITSWRLLQNFRWQAGDWWLTNTFQTFWCSHRVLIYTTTLCTKKAKLFCRTK